MLEAEELIPCFFSIFTIWLISESNKIRYFLNLYKSWTKGSKICCKPKEQEIKGNRPIMKSCCNITVSKNWYISHRIACCTWRKLSSMRIMQDKIGWEGVEEKNESKERKWLPPRVVASRARDCNFCTSSHIVWLVSLKISVIYKFLFWHFIT